MNKIIERGYTEPVPTDDRKVWYLPYHGLFLSQKPEKIRVVFGCSARNLGDSSNNEILQGPNLTNNLLDVLMRFRQDKIAVLCNIESCFIKSKYQPKTETVCDSIGWRMET